MNHARSLRWSRLASAGTTDRSAPVLYADGPRTPGSTATLHIDALPAATTVWLVVGLSRVDAPLLGGTPVPSPDLSVPLVTDSEGRATYSIPLPSSAAPGTQIFAQVLWSNASGTEAAFSNALQVTVH